MYCTCEREGRRVCVNAFLSCKLTVGLAFTALPDSTLWVGAHTEFAMNNWRWISGMPLSTGVPFWAYEQGHDNGEDCAAMDSSSYFQLADYDCSTPM